MTSQHITVNALTNDRSENLVHTAQVDDIDAALVLRDLYLARGLKVRFRDEDKCLIDEFVPVV
jgi:hypothetical protein